MDFFGINVGKTTDGPVIVSFVTDHHTSCVWRQQLHKEESNTAAAAFIDTKKRVSHAHFR